VEVRSSRPEHVSEVIECGRERDESNGGDDSLLISAESTDPRVDVVQRRRTCSYRPESTKDVDVQSWSSDKFISENIRLDVSQVVVRDKLIMPNRPIVYCTFVTIPIGYLKMSQSYSNTSLYKQESLANAKGMRDSSACMKAHCPRWCSH